MRKLREEVRHLVMVTAFADGKGVWLLKWAGGQKSFRCSIEKFAGVLRKIKAKDQASQPRSRRELTYMEIAQEILSGTDRLIWVWSNDLRAITDITNYSLSDQGVMDA